MRRFAILALLFASVSAFPQVAYDAQASNGAFGASPFTYTLTLGGGGSNRAAMIGIAVGSGSNPPALAITVGGVSASAVSGAAGGSFPIMSLYCVALGSATGAQTVSISWTGGGSFYVASGSISATGVNQSTPCINGNEASGSSPKGITITSVNGDLTSTVVGNATGDSTSSQTRKWSVNAAASYFADGDIGAGTGTATHTWTAAGANETIIGADFESSTVTVATPSFGLTGGSYVSGLPQSSSITTGTAAATICYTVCNTNGCSPSAPAASTPGTCSAGTTLTNGSSVTLPSGYETLSALGTKSGDANSAVATSSQYQSVPVVANINGVTIGVSAGNIAKLGAQQIGYAAGNANAIGTLSAPIIAADGFVNFEGLSNGVAPTITTMNNSTFPNGLCTWGVQNTNSSLTGATSGQLSNFVTPILVSNTIYTGTGSLGLQYATGTGGDGVYCTLPLTYPSLSTLKWMKWTILDNDTAGNAYDLASIQASGDYIDAALVATGTALCMELEIDGAGDFGCITVHPSTLYGIYLDAVKSGTDTLTVYSATGAVVGTVTHANHNNTANWGLIYSAVPGAELQTSGKDIWEDNWKISLSGAQLTP